MARHVPGFQELLATMQQSIRDSYPHNLTVPLNPASDVPALYELDSLAKHSIHLVPLVSAVLRALGSASDSDTRRAVVDFFATAITATHFTDIARELAEGDLGAAVGPNSRGVSLLGLAEQLEADRATLRHPPLIRGHLKPYPREVTLNTSTDLAQEFTQAATANFHVLSKFWSLARRSDWVQAQLSEAISIALSSATRKRLPRLLSALQYTELLPLLLPALETLDETTLTPQPRKMLLRLRQQARSV